MLSSADIALVLLAAGKSSRMGQHKLLLPLGGRPLASYAVEAALASHARPVIVVLGHNSEAVREVMPPGGLSVVLNPAYAEGMSTSLRAGIDAVPNGARGAIIALADQPLVSPALLNALLRAASAEPEAIVTTSYGSRRGTPVCFPRAYFAELAAVSGDEGGRSIIAAHEEHVRTVAAAFVKQGIDVDRPGEYEQLLADWDRYSQMMAG